MSQSADNSIAVQKNPLAGRHVLIFDWDGTLFDSMPIKRQTFSEVVSDYLLPRNPDVSAKTVLALYKQHGGRPRRDIFAEVAKHYGLTLSDADYEAMSKALSDRNTEALKEAELFEDARVLLQALEKTIYQVYISSSVPPQELQRLVFGAISPQIKRRISGVFGSKPGFSKGPEHIAYICEKEECGPEACIMFGDDDADCRLSQKAGIASTLIDRSGQAAVEDALPSLKDVIAWL